MFVDCLKKKKVYSRKEIQKLVHENSHLSEQIKRLVKTEYALYNTQSELDNQIVLYKGLYETGKKISVLMKIKSIFSEMGNFIIDRLNYGGYIVLEKNKTTFTIKHSGGCCIQRTMQDGSCGLRWMETTLKTICDGKRDYIVTEQSNDDDCLARARAFFGLAEFVVHAFSIGKTKTPSFLLIVGNPPDKEFFNAIAPNTIALIGLGNLVSLIENALNNVIHYSQLVEERKLLEIKVVERTEDLHKALKDLKKLNAQLSFLSFKDELTGLYNRRGFSVIGEKYFNMAKRKNTDLLILFCDLDKFKAINDVFGHKEGDFALKQTAMILRNAFRNYDIISRFGGDEFVVLLENTSAPDFPIVKKRLDKIVSDYNLRSHKKYQISISYGFSSYNRNTNENITFDELIEQADKMLYLEKRKKINTRAKEP